MEVNNKIIPKRHLFICTKCQAKGHECDTEYAGRVRKFFKQKLGEIYTKSELRVNAAGCLGVCEDGIHAVIYPEGTWFKKVDESSLPELIHHLRN